VQVGALGWFVTSGHVLVGTFALLALLSMQRAAARATDVPARRAALWWLLGLAMATSYSTGMGVAVVLWVIAALILPVGIAGWRRAVGALASLVVIIPALYAVVYVFYERLYDVELLYPTPVFHASLTNWVRTVAQGARLTADFLTYGIGVILGGSLVYVASVEGVAVGPWRGTAPQVLLPALRLPCLALLLGGVWALRGAPRPLRRAAVALTVLLVSDYGVIAWGAAIAGRLNLNETVDLFGGGVAGLSTGQAVVARHHYAATIFLAALLATVADSMARRSPGSRRTVHAVALVAVLSLALRQGSHRELVRSAVQSASHMSGYRRVLAAFDRAAERGQPGAVIHLENKPLGAGFLTLKGEYFPGWAGVMAIFHPDGIIRGRSVRFIERGPRLLAVLRAQTNTPISRLVVSSDEVPPS
jgi:hypothetical protein